METYRMEKTAYLENFIIHQMAYLLYKPPEFGNFCVTDQFPFYGSQLAV